MREIFLDDSFDVEETTVQINSVMSKWSICLLDINGHDWLIYDYDMNLRYLFRFRVDFQNIETRIKLEDLKLNIIHHIESLKDETTYRDNLISSQVLK